MWMGGHVPLGYDVRDRKLVINEREAETIRHIFRRYLELGSVRALMSALDSERIRTKVQAMRDGSKRGGVPFARGPLYCLLKNPIYAGQTRHHKAVYAGQHEPLLPRELWDRVQALLAENGAKRRLGTNAAEPSLLAGRINDGAGRPMVASHTKKGARRYRYYISAPGTEVADSRGLRLSAGEVETLVCQGIAELLDDAGKLGQDLEASGVETAIFQTTVRCSRTADGVPAMAVPEMRQLLSEMDVKVAIQGDRLTGSYVPRGLVGSEYADAEQQQFPFTIPGVLTRRGHEARLVLVADRPGRRRPNSRLISLLVRSFAARRALIEETPPSDRSAANARKSYLSRIARMSYLAPDIVQAILEGTQPAMLGAREMLRTSELPISWREQRRLFGFSDAVA